MIIKYTQDIEKEMLIMQTIKQQTIKKRKELLSSEERITDINIQEAIVHILDTNAGEPLLNEYVMDLTEDVYKFIYRHLEKCFKSDNLRFAIYNDERNIVREVCEEYFKDGSINIVQASKEIAQQFFAIMNGNMNIPCADLLVVTLFTDRGPFIGILKMDYVKNFTHQVDFVNDKLGISLIPHNAGLPGASQKIQKAAFIRPFNPENSYDLLVIDESSKKKDEDEYGANYFVNHLLGCSIINSNKDYTKRFSDAVEVWTRTNVLEDAEKAEKIRGTVNKVLKENDTITIEEIAANIFDDEIITKENFSEFIKASDVPEEFVVDKPFAEKKTSKKKIKVDKDIVLTISQDSYDDLSKFEIVKNGDGTINMVIKNIVNYIEQ